jgi:DNA/RNA endonuclease YhcR with UshA esterase domain
MMRFTVEQIFLTDDSGSVTHVRPKETHVVEADGVDAALNEFLSGHRADLVGRVQKFPGLEAIATARRARRVFTLHVARA